MVDVKITDFVEKTTLEDADLFEIVDSTASASKKAQLSNIGNRIFAARDTGDLTEGNNKYISSAQTSDITTNNSKVSFATDQNSSLDTTGSPTFANIDYTGQSASPVFTLTDGATITPDFNNGNIQEVTLAGNRTLANPTNQKSGARYAIIVNQDATGSRTLTFGTDYLFAGGTVPTLTTAASSKDILVFLSDGTNLIAESGLDFK